MLKQFIGKIIKNKYVILIVTIVLLYQLTETEGFRGKMHKMAPRAHPRNRGRGHGGQGHGKANKIPSNKIPSNKIPSNNIIIHKHANTKSESGNRHLPHRHLPGARVPSNWIPIAPSHWTPGRRHPVDPHLVYPSRRVNNRRWWDYLSFTWVPKLLGVCKRGCTYLGKGTYGCTHPGSTFRDCQFASDCRWC